MVYTHDGILLLSLKKEILTYATTWMKVEDIVISEANHKKTNIIQLHLHEVFYLSTGILRDIEFSSRLLK